MSVLYKYINKITASNAINLRPLEVKASSRGNDGILGSDTAQQLVTELSKHLFSKEERNSEEARGIGLYNNLKYAVKNPFRPDWKERVAKYIRGSSVDIAAEELAALAELFRIGNTPLPPVFKAAFKNALPYIVFSTRGFTDPASRSRQKHLKRLAQHYNMPNINFTGRERLTGAKFFTADNTQTVGPKPRNVKANKKKTVVRKR